MDRPGAQPVRDTYLLERRSTIEVIDALLGDLDRGAFRLDCGEQDIARVRDLIHRYADLPLGVVDASVVACAERNGGRVLTLDLRHFGVVAREGRLSSCRRSRSGWLTDSLCSWRPWVVGEPASQRVMPKEDAECRSGRRFSTRW